MTDKEKLEKVRAEIKRRKKLHEKSLINPIHEGFGLQKVIESKISELTYLLSFIDSMQKEPTIPDIVDEHYLEMFGEEPVSEELNTAAKEYANNITDKIGYRLQLRRAVCFGAKWQKEQMMAKAIRGRVNFNVKSNYHSLIYGCWDMDNALENCNDGDKVKIIVIKED